jgi:hypothetical protein
MSAESQEKKGIFYTPVLVVKNRPSNHTINDSDIRCFFEFMLQAFNQHKILFDLVKKPKIKAYFKSLFTQNKECVEKIISEKFSNKSETAKQLKELDLINGNSQKNVKNSEEKKNTHWSLVFKIV